MERFLLAGGQWGG